MAEKNILFLAGWYHRLNNRVGNRGLTFYKLVPLLRKEAEYVRVEVRLMANGQGGRDTRPTYRQLDQKIRDLWDQYSSVEISTARLLRGCRKNRKKKKKENKKDMVGKWLH